MKKFILILAVTSLAIPISMLDIHKGSPFTLGNVYEILEFALYFLAVYLMILAKMFESRQITPNQPIE